MYSHRTRLSFWHITLKDILIIICSVAIPLALAIYMSMIQEQEEQADEESRRIDSIKAQNARQQRLYERFLDQIYKLDKNGYLAENHTPWAFANAYYRAANRQWNPERKSDALQFLREHRLIGRSDCSLGCRRNVLPDIVRVNKLSLEYIQLISQTGTLNYLNFDCTTFDRILLNYAIFSSVNLNGAIFNGGRGRYVTFQGSSLRCAEFIDMDLEGVDFGDSDLTDAYFLNVNLSNAKLTDQQLEQAIFENCTLPEGFSDKIKRRTRPPIIETVTEHCRSSTDFQLNNRSTTSTSIPSTSIHIESSITTDSVRTNLTLTTSVHQRAMTTGTPKMVSGQSSPSITHTSNQITKMIDTSGTTGQQTDPSIINTVNPTTVTMGNEKATTGEKTDPSIRDMVNPTTMTMGNEKATTGEKTDPSIRDMVNPTTMTMGNEKATTGEKTDTSITNMTKVSTYSIVKTTEHMKTIDTTPMHTLEESTKQTDSVLVSNATSFNPIINGGFETGDTRGWILGGGDRASVNRSSIVAEQYLPNGIKYNASIAGTHSSIVNRTEDPVLLTLMPEIVHSGNYALRVEDTKQGSFLSVVTQVVHNYTFPRIYFAWLAVLHTGHSGYDSSFLLIELKDASDNTLLLEISYNSDIPKLNDTARFLPHNLYLYTPSWQVENVSIPSTRLGHDFSLTVLVSDCDSGAHLGYVYIDDFGPTVP